jgi:hypothetical protein
LGERWEVEVSSCKRALDVLIIVLCAAAAAMDHFGLVRTVMQDCIHEFGPERRQRGVFELRKS